MGEYGYGDNQPNCPNTTITTTHHHNGNGNGNGTGDSGKRFRRILAVRRVLIMAVIMAGVPTNNVSASDTSNTSMGTSTACWPPSSPPDSVSSGCMMHGICLPSGSCACNVDYLGVTCTSYWRDSDAWHAYQITRTVFAVAAAIIWIISTWRCFVVVKARHCRSTALAAIVRADGTIATTHGGNATHAATTSSLPAANGNGNGNGHTLSHGHGNGNGTPNSAAIAAHTAAANHNNLLVQNAGFTARLFQHAIQNQHHVNNASMHGSGSSHAHASVVTICGCECILPAAITQWLTQQVICLACIWISSTFGVVFFVDPLGVSHLLNGDALYMWAAAFSFPQAVALAILLRIFIAVQAKFQALSRRALVVSDVLLGIFIPLELLSFITPAVPYLIRRQIRSIVQISGTIFLVYTAIGWILYSWLTLRGVYAAATARLKARLNISEQDQNALMLMKITRVVTAIFVILIAFALVNSRLDLNEPSYLLINRYFGWGLQMAVQLIMMTAVGHARSSSSIAPRAPVYTVAPAATTTTAIHSHDKRALPNGASILLSPISGTAMAAAGGGGGGSTGRRRHDYYGGHNHSNGFMIATGDITSPHGNNGDTSGRTVALSSGGHVGAPAAASAHGGHGGHASSLMSPSIGSGSRGIGMLGFTTSHNETTSPVPPSTPPHVHVPYASLPSPSHHMSSPLLATRTSGGGGAGGSSLPPLVANGTSTTPAVSTIASAASIAIAISGSSHGNGNGTHNNGNNNNNNGRHTPVQRFTSLHSNHGTRSMRSYSSDDATHGHAHGHDHARNGHNYMVRSSSPVMATTTLAIHGGTGLPTSPMNQRNGITVGNGSNGNGSGVRYAVSPGHGGESAMSRDDDDNDDGDDGDGNNNHNTINSDNSDHVNGMLT